MLIPSIDLMNGRVVQLEQGSRLALESRDIDGWIARFADFPIVQLIDLDAAMGRGDNAALVRDICRRLRCQVGGGVRSPEVARALLMYRYRRLGEEWFICPDARQLPTVRLMKALCAQLAKETLSAS